MRLGRVFCFLILFGISAIAAHGQTTVPDPHDTLNHPDPTCPPGDFCVDFTFHTTSATPVYVSQLTFEVPMPPGQLPENPPPFTCSTNVFPDCKSLDNSPPNPGTEFYGFVYYGGAYLTNGETFILFSNEPILLDLPTNLPPGSSLTCNSNNPCPDGVISATPEPGSSLLYMTGLIFLVGFTKKRFGANFSS